MRWITGATVPLGLAIFALGCTDEPVGPSDGSPAAPESTAAVDVSPLSNFLNGPESPGNSPVSRFASGGCYLCETFDPDSRIVAEHYQADDVFFCGGGSGFSAWAVQEVSKDGGLQEHGQLRDAPVFLYDLDEFIAALGGTFPEFCNYLANGWQYQGTHDMNLNYWEDSDGFAAHWTGHGFVYDQDGNQFRYREDQQGTNEGFWRETITVH